jgi:hypothetical protein
MTVALSACSLACVALLFLVVLVAVILVLSLLLVSLLQPAHHNHSCLVCSGQSPVHQLHRPITSMSTMDDTEQAAV